MNHRMIKALTEALAPIVDEHVAARLQPLIKRIEAAEARVPEKGDKGDPGERGPQGEPGEPGTKGEPGPSGIEGRDGQPGIAGRDGKDGSPGINGKDGAPGKDGFSLDDFDVITNDRGRTFEFKFVGADHHEKKRVIKTASPIHQGVWQEKDYDDGDVVIWDGSWFIAQKDKPQGRPTSSPDWRLTVKRGRDGKDGVVKPVEPKLVALK